MNQYGRWLGESKERLPQGAKQAIINQIPLKEYGDDVSVVSDPDVNFVLFYLSDKYSNAYQITKRICSNLDKKIVVLHEGDFTDSEAQEIEHIDTESNVIKDKIDDLIQQLKSNNLIPTKNCLNLMTEENLSQSHQNFIDTVSHFVDKNIANDIREENVAAMCHFSVTYFSKLFHKVSGISFQEYIIHTRVNAAKQYLKDNPKCKIAAAAYHVGYKDVSYFNRVFKKVMKMTPTQYRKQL